MGDFGMGSGDLPGLPGSNTSFNAGDWYGYQPGSRQFGFEVPVGFGGGRYAANNISEDGKLKQVDVRTKNMVGLEEATLPLLLTALLNPSGLNNMMRQLSGPMPQAHGFDPATNIASQILNTQGTQFNPQPAQGTQNSAAQFLQQLLGGGVAQAPGTASDGNPMLPPPPQLQLPPPPDGFGPALDPHGGDIGPGPDPWDTTGWTPPTAPIDPATGQPFGAPWTITPDMPVTTVDASKLQNPAKPDPATVGSQLGGGQVDMQSPNAMNKLLNPADILKQFGILPDSASGSGFAGTYGAFSGLMPGTGAPGQELNLGYLNQLLNPQGYVLGTPNPSYGPAPFYKPNPRSMELFGPDSLRQSFGADASGISALQQLLQSKGVQFKAGGGPLDINAPTIVGEQGPELIAPNGAGQPQVHPLGGGFNMSAMQGPGTGPSQRLMEQNPEMQTFNISKGILGGQQNPGMGVMQAMQPVFNQNLQSGLGQLRSAAPSVFSTGFANQGMDLTQKALNDFNLVAAQAMQQGVGQQQQGLGILGQIASSAGQGNIAQQQLAENARQFNLGQLPMAQAQSADILGRLGIAQGQDPYQRLLMGTQAGLTGAQAGQTQMQTQLMPQQFQEQQRQFDLGQLPMVNAQAGLLGAQTGDVGAARQQSQQQIDLQRMLGVGQLGLGQQQLGEQSRQFNLGQLPLVGGQADLMGAQAYNTRAQGQSTLGMLPYQQQQVAAQTGDIGAARQQAGYGLETQRATGFGSLANEQLLGLRSQDINQQLALAQLAQNQQQFMSNYGLQSQQQGWNQTVNPTLQLLLAALAAGSPTAYQTVYTG